MVKLLFMNFVICDDKYVILILGLRKIVEKFGFEIIRILIENCLVKEFEQDIVVLEVVEFGLIDYFVGVGILINLDSIIRVDNLFGK